MNAYCPDCHEPVDVAPSAREGRCSACRPSRRHSEPRIPHPNEVLHHFVRGHDGDNAARGGVGELR